MLAYDYPVMGVFWSMLYFFIFFIWIMLLFQVFGDLFRDKEESGFAKVLWILFVILAPFLGIFIYLIVRGSGMAERSIAAAKNQEAAMQDYIKTTAGTASSADELARLADLKEKGHIDQAEYDKMKAKIIG